MLPDFQWSHLHRSKEQIQTRNIDTRITLQISSNIKTYHVYISSYQVIECDSVKLGRSLSRCAPVFGRRPMQALSRPGGQRRHGSTDQPGKFAVGRPVPGHSRFFERRLRDPEEFGRRERVSILADLAGGDHLVSKHRVAESDRPPLSSELRVVFAICADFLREPEALCKPRKYRRSRGTQHGAD